MICSSFTDLKVKAGKIRHFIQITEKGCFCPQTSRAKVQ